MQRSFCTHALAQFLLQLFVKARIGDGVFLRLGVETRIFDRCRRMRRKRSRHLNMPLGVVTWYPITKVEQTNDPIFDNQGDAQPTANGFAAGAAHPPHIVMGVTDDYDAPLFNHLAHMA